MSMSSSFISENAGPCEGFDSFAGKLWIYPNNMAIRGYQKQAVEKSLFTNAMIVLPTGFGKTFIAAVVMYNFYRWYPQGKIIFVAPTRPLVAQQIQECKKISGIPSSDCVELTGSTPREKRSLLWTHKRVIFATPQVIENDLETQTLPASQVRCLVIDEAHRAQGGYAYVGIVKSLQEANKDGFRVLALSATPGSDIQRVQQVMLNLLIGDVMFRSEQSIDLAPFKNAKVNRAWTVELSGKHGEIVRKFIQITAPTFKELHRAGLTYSGDSIERVSKFTLIKSMQSVSRNEAGNLGRAKGRLGFLCCAAISLSQQFELLTLYGLRVFHCSLTRALADTKGGGLKTVLAGKVELDLILEDIRAMFGDDLQPDPDKRPTRDLLQGHPKLRVVRDLLMNHFRQNADKKETRAMVFTKYRDSVYDIVQTLRAFEPDIRASAFVGQGTASKTGLKQREQIQMVQDFKEGKFNVLVATCVAEEGLDIGEIDLIVCYDTSSSPISSTQRRGRTGRKRSGDVQNLLTKGYEEKKLSKASSSRRSVEEQLFKRENYSTVRYREAPRMVPAGVLPVCMEQRITPVDDEPERPAAGRRRGAQGRAPAAAAAASAKKARRKGQGKLESDSDCCQQSKAASLASGPGSDSDSDLSIEFHARKTPARQLHADEDVAEISAAGSQSSFVAAGALVGAARRLHLSATKAAEDRSGPAAGAAGAAAPAAGPSAATGRPAKAAESADSDIDWGSELDFDCV